MSVAISRVRAALAKRLKGVSPKLQVKEYWPDTVNMPCAIVRPVSGNYHQAMSSPGATEMVFEVTILTGSVQNSPENGQKALDEYLDDDGPKSLKKAIEGDVTLAGIAHSLIVSGWSNYGSLAVAEIEYVGAQLAVTVWPKDSSA